MISLPIESELQVVRLKMYLEKNPQEAKDLALQHYEDFWLWQSNIENFRLNLITLKPAC